MARVLIGMLLVTVVATTARGADNKPAAKDAYEAGRRHYDLGEYADALTEFKKAYLNYPEPVFLFNIAICYRQLGDNKAAIRSYRAFLDNWPKAPNRAAVERMIAELQSQPPQNPAPTVTATAQQTPKASTGEPRPQATATQPPAKSAQATSPRQQAHTPPSAKSQQQAMVTPTPPPSPKPEAEHRPSRFDVTEMEEITPNFETRSGSKRREKVKPWVWGVTGTAIALVVGGVAALVVIETRGTTAGSSFHPTLPDFNAPSASRITPVAHVSF